MYVRVCTCARRPDAREGKRETVMVMLIISSTLETHARAPLPCLIGDL